MKKTFLAFFLTLTAMFVLLTLPANAAEVVDSGTCGDDLTWELTDDGVLTIRGKGDVPDYSNLTERPWNNCSASVTSVVVEDGVERLGSYNFQNFKSLNSVTLSDTVITIGDSAFSGCANLEKVSFGAGLRSIGQYAFFRCVKLTDFELPELLMSIGKNAFYDCDSLRRVTLPGSLQDIGDGMFTSCDNLVSVALPDGISGISNSMFSNCDSLTSVTIPNSVTSIGSDAFYHCSSLMSVTIPDSVVSIGDSTFRNCSGMTSVTIPSSVTAIGEQAFFTCSSLTDILVDAGNPTYRSVEGALLDKNGTELICCPAGKTGTYRIPDGVTTIGEQAFYECVNLSSAPIPNSVTSIGEYAFWGCKSLTSIEIPDSVTTVGEYAFARCSGVTRVTIPDGLFISEGLFYSCSSLSNVTIPNGIFGIGALAFNNCSLTSVTIPDGVKKLGEGAFGNCGNLTTVTIPKSVTSIGEAAFFGSGVKIVYYSGTEEQWRAIYFGKFNSQIQDKATILYNGATLAVTTQPRDYVGAVNSTAKFTVAVFGYGLTYQWQYSDDNGATWLPSSLKTASYSAKLTAEKHGRQVRCVVTDENGNSVVSSAAKMTIAAPEITTQPQDYTGTLNSMVKISVAASGSGLTYQWQYSDDGGAAWLESSLKSAVYSAKLTAEKYGRMVRCIVSDQFGRTVTSAPAKMSIKGVEIITQPVDYVGAVNSTAKFKVVASGDGLKYQWYYSDNYGRWWIGSSLKSATYSAKFTAEKNNRMLRCVVTDQYGNSVTSNAVRMILTGPTITVQPQNYVGAVNTTARFTVAVSGDDLTYQWQYSDDNGATWLASSLKTATYSAKFTAEKNGRMVRCIVTDAYGSSVTSNAASMQLN